MARPRKTPDTSRAALRLLPHQAKLRRCLRCSQVFTSAWCGNRLCAACRGKPEDGEIGSVSCERIMP